MSPQVFCKHTIGKQKAYFAANVQLQLWALEMTNIGSYLRGSSNYMNWTAEVRKNTWEHLYTVQQNGQHEIIIDAYDIEANLISTITDFLDSTASFPEPSQFEDYVKTYKDIDDAREEIRNWRRNRGPIPPEVLAELVADDE